MMTEASALFTCWLASLASSATHGMMVVRMASVLYSSPRFSENSATTEITCIMSSYVLQKKT